MLNIPEDIHPEIRRGLEAIETPEIQVIIKKLSEHGLAVALPHAHGKSGSFLPLPKDQVVFESGLRVSFQKKNSSVLELSIPVMWRWDGEVEGIASCATCDLYVHS